MMSPRVEFAYYAVWATQFGLQGAVTGIMFRRKLQRTFPVFFAYLLFQMLMSAVLLPISLKGTYAEYFYTYWIATAVSLVLGFSVIHEVFAEIFRPYHTLKDLGTVAFKWAGLVMLLAAAVVAAASSAGEEGPLVQAVLTVQRCVRVIQCGLVLFLLLFARYLGVSRKQQSFGVPLGFGIFAFVELMSAALRASASISENSASFAIMGAYNLAIMTWCRYMWVKVKAREDPSTLLTSQRWDESLMDLHYTASSDSLIPMFEGMVEKALLRTKNAAPGNETEEDAAVSSSLQDASESSEDYAGSTLARRRPSPKP
jgi:hypothetical protein